MVRRVLVTGAAGFVGRRVVTDLRAAGVDVVATARLPGPGLTAIGTVTSSTDWQPLLAGCDGVIHLLARVHRGGRGSDADYLADNRDITERLARDAAAAGVRRLVFVSSIKVNGETSAPGAPFRPDDPPAPADAYGRSKLAAEQALQAVSEETGLEVAVVRPPLVYGPGVRANFALLIRLVALGLPLPFAGLGNRRSLVGLGNLADLLRVCLDQPAAAGETFLVADGPPLTLAELLGAIGRALRRPVRLFGTSPRLLALALRLAGGPGLADRLAGELVVDDSKTRMLLGWQPPHRLDEELAATIAARGR
jgi:nucleoside-diphosphate-sugar epimerase